GSDGLRSGSGEEARRWFETGNHCRYPCSGGRMDFKRPTKMKIIGIIPARYASTRFPGKPLALIAGKPLIQHVVEQCQKAKSLSQVFVATDDTRIWEVAQNFCQVEMTSPDHPSGTDRIAEVVQRTACDAAINIQGDEPMIDPAVIDAVAQVLSRDR